VGGNAGFMYGGGWAIRIIYNFPPPPPPNTSTSSLFFHRCIVSYRVSFFFFSWR